MSLTRFSAIALVIMSLAISGCSGSLPDDKVVVTSSAISGSARETLEGIEKSGVLGSTITALESDINGIKSTDAVKGEALSKAYRELQGLTEADEIKAKAKEMIGKL